MITYENKGCYIRITYQKRVISRTAGRESICHQTGRIQLVNRLNSTKYRNFKIIIKTFLGFHQYTFRFTAETYKIYLSEQQNGNFLHDRVCNECQDSRE